MSKKKEAIAAAPDEELKKFDYRALDNRIYPKRGFDDQAFTKIDDINMVHKIIAEKSEEIVGV